MAKEPLKNNKSKFADYEAVSSTNRRRTPRVTLKSADNHLKTGDRKKLISAARDMHRNFAVAGWAIRKHLDFTTQFTLQVQSGKKELDDRVENLMAWYSEPENCDVAGRHSLNQIIRLAEQHRIIDGDVFLVKLGDGKIQPIEGDRVRTPRDLPDWADKENVTHGVIHTSSGKARNYIVCRRNKYNQFELERVLRSGFVIHHGFFERYDQVRGISPLAPVINSLRDVHEAHEYALAKMKLSQLLGLFFYKEDYDPDAEGDDVSGAYELNVKDSLYTVYMEPGEKVDLVESKNPSTEFANFSKQSLADALKGLDIPYSYYDEAHTNYSGAREAMLLHNKSAKAKREQVRNVLNHITRWRLGLFVEDGILNLPANTTINDLKFEWVYQGLPWIDPLKETMADIRAIEAGLASSVEVAKRRGKSAYDIADEEAKLREYRKNLNLDNED